MLQELQGIKESMEKTKSLENLHLSVLLPAMLVSLKVLVHSKERVQMAQVEHEGRRLKKKKLRKVY